jgi:hypothetical protein
MPDDDFKLLEAFSQKPPAHKPPKLNYDKTLFLHERMKTLAGLSAFKAATRIRRERFSNKAANDPNPYNAYMRMLKRGRK